ncbi:uncharacterized protein ColSpa_00564 [Colletotrichum spaethianum]|uniref:Uncharacterized protein n=1 Tax=Colletotrichum spaethianum TaxID=700344 RepID=A0AA37L6A1_9PEZI|nr:uncharacterized protein ColSpa_00564 [Colletotrichum spaethianum]GKT40383.1 hypothetical protein ColSpa_00564 [Colletotrichum spaethianum]
MAECQMRRDEMNCSLTRARSRLRSAPAHVRCKADTSSLLGNTHHNLPGGGPLLELLVRLDDVLELKGRVDHGLDLALGHPRRDLREVVVRVLCHEGLKLVLRAAQEPGQEHARHEALNLREGDGAADELEVARGDQELVRGLVQVRRGVADVVDDEGKDLALRAEGADDVRGLVVDDLVGAQGLAQVGLGRGARDRHVAAEGLCDLDAVGPRAAGTAVDEDLVAGLDVGHDGLVRREGGRADGAGLLEVHRARDGGDAVALGSDGVDTTEYEVARLDVGDGRADGDGAAGVVHTGALGEGHHRLGDDAEVRELVVGRVDARGDHLDKDLVSFEGRGGGRRNGDEGEVLDEGARGGDLPAAHLGGGLLAHDYGRDVCIVRV